MRPASTQLAIVVPCYNEDAVIRETCARVTALLEQLRDARKISGASRVCFVDDGSDDATWSIVTELVRSGLPVIGIKLSANRGHQNALLAGLLCAEGDAVVSIDADLQDDLRAVEAMVDRFHEGCDIVYGVRKHRGSDGFFKRVGAACFYRLMTSLGARTMHNHADCRLMSRRAVEALREYREVNLFLRGIVPLLGFRTATVEYDRLARRAGRSKYSLGRMLALAAEGITSFSVVPLRLISLVGLVVFAGAMGVTLWALWASLFTDKTIPGWASVVLPMYFLGGVQLFALGVMGEYLGKIYVETKARPRFIIEEVIGDRNAKPGEDRQAPEPAARAAPVS
jgi:glycosyltransferase involved in cell wall biosynthesis